MIKILKKIIKKILGFLGVKKYQEKKLVKEVPLIPRPTPDEFEQRCIDEFRNEIRALPTLLQTSDMPDAERKWIDRQKKLRENILTKDPRDFFTWEEVKYSMLAPEYCAADFEFLKKSPMWPEWRKALSETEFSEINVSWDEPYVSRSTVIGNAYKLSQLLLAKKIDLRNIKTIFEFGGGYGSIARLCFKLGFKGTYIVFDLPEFSALQRYFLRASRLPATVQSVPVRNPSQPTVVALSDINKLREQIGYTNPDIFIATWSLSESPLSLREVIVKLIKNVRYYLITYQEQFPILTGVDNVAYFKKLEIDNKDREWKTYPAVRWPKNYYLIAEKK